MNGQNRKRQYGKQAVFAGKAAAATCFSIIAAETLKLDFASSAGIITLLTLLSTRRETVRLAGRRLLSFGVAAFLSWLVFGHLDGIWLPYGIYVFLLVGISTILGLGNTISVNAVIGTHLMTDRNFEAAALLNELCLVLIGVSVSMAVNLFHDNQGQRERIIQDMREIEGLLQGILISFAQVLTGQERPEGGEEKIRDLEDYLEAALERSAIYQGNSFASHAEYYIRYMEMRIMQCGILRNLYAEIGKIREKPRQAETVAEYFRYVSHYVKERNVPEKQKEKLREMKKAFRLQSLPEAREEFESRAVLYHVLMELEEFLELKSRFVDSLDEKQRQIYWKVP